MSLKSKMAYEADRLKLHKHKAAENIALLATCKAQEINPREYLNDVIAKLPYYLEKDSGKNVRELLPDVWKLENPTRIQLEFKYLC